MEGLEYDVEEDIEEPIVVGEEVIDKLEIGADGSNTNIEDEYFNNVIDEASAPVENGNATII